MPNSYYPMGGVPEGYAGILQSAQQNLVRMPDGSFQPAPQFSQAGDLQSVLHSIYPPGTFSPAASDAQSEQNYSRNNPGLTSHSIHTIQVDARGNPIIPNGSGGSAYLSPNGGQLMAQGMPPQIPGPNGYTSMTKDQSRLSSGGQAFAYGNGAPTAPGVAAINGATQPGIPLPRVRPPTPMPPGPGGAWSGGWGSSAIGRFLSGDPGQTDWSQANQGGAGLNGPIGAPSSLPPNRLTVRGGAPSIPAPPRLTPAIHAALMARQGQNNTTPYSQSPAGLNPSIHQQLMAQQSSDQRGKGALDAAGTLKILGF